MAMSLQLHASAHSWLIICIMNAVFLVSFAFVVMKDKTIIAMITFQSCKILSVSIGKLCAVFLVTDRLLNASIC